MRVIEQKKKIGVRNVDILTVDVCKPKSKHGCLLPDTVRCIITGPSNCGKTNVVFNLLTDPNGLKYNNIYIFSKSLHQPKYQLLERILSEVPDVSYFQFHANEDVIHPNEARPYSIFVFDDVSCENQDNIRNYFAMGRHNNIDSIYIGQTYSRIPKQLIRDNTNLLLIFKQDERNLRHIYNDHVNTDMTFDQFKYFSGKCWEDKYGFAVIAKDSDMNSGRYRIGFDRFAIL